MAKAGRTLRWHLNSHAVSPSFLTFLLGLLEVLEGEIPQVRIVTQDERRVRAYLRYWIIR